MPSERTFTDQMGRAVTLPYPPKRIISLVPSQTELLFDLGLEKQIIGVTKFCVHPAVKVAAVTKIGGTKKLNIDLICSLKPDLIIANKEENEQSQIEHLMQYFPVWISDIHDLGSALEMIRAVGALTDRSDNADIIANETERLFAEIEPAKRRSVAYLIWRKPYMLAGKATFIDDMLKRCGLINTTQLTRYPEATMEKLTILKPDVIFLSSEPYPFQQKHADELQQHLPDAKIYLVDGEMFSWYGSRLLKAAPYFKQLMESITI